MLIFHKPPWLVGSNGNGCQIERPKPFPYFLKGDAVAGVSRKKEPVPGTQNRPASPKNLVFVRGGPFAPMLSGSENKGDRVVARNAVLSPPVQFDDVLAAVFLHPV
uniref:Uncharacterized protein n=1 Tax=Micrurus lemniscatus lemniscatus TaxID=129467 RepID=A0A2D4J7I2_MICLE